MCHDVTMMWTLVTLLSLVTIGHCQDTDQVSAPTSHWASVYTGDTAPPDTPVTNVHYPLPEGVSRSDWFESYPYHKFEDSAEDKNDEDKGIVENLIDSVGNVRKAIQDFGDGVVDSAMNIVGVGVKNDQDKKLKEEEEVPEERDGKPDPLIDFSLDLSFGLPNIGYVYNGFHLRGPQSESQFHPQYHHQSLNNRLAEEPLAVDGNTARPTFVKAEEISPIEKFRRGVRSYLDPIVDPMVDPIKRFFKTDPSENQDRRQTLFQGPLAPLRSLGQKVSEGFSILTGSIKKSSQSPVSHIHSSHSVSARAKYNSNEILSEGSHPKASYALPTLPPLYYPPKVPPPQPVSSVSDVVYQHVRAPHQQRQYQESPQKIIVYPPTQTYQEESSQEDVSFNEIPDQPLHLSIVPLLKAAFRRKKQILHRDIPSLLGFGQPKPKNNKVEDVVETKKPLFSIGEPVVSRSKNVMFYLPSPDLSRGKEKAGNVPHAKVDYKTKLIPENYFDTESTKTNDNNNDGFDGKSVNFKVSGLQDVLEDAESTTAIYLSPAETIIVDISDVSQQTNNDLDQLLDEEVYDEIFNNEVEPFEAFKV